MEMVLLYGKALLHTNQADKASQFFWERIREFPEQKILYRTLIDINRQRFNQAGLLEVLRLKKKQFPDEDRKSTRLNSSHVAISYAVFCLKKKRRKGRTEAPPQDNAEHSSPDVSSTGS